MGVVGIHQIYALRGIFNSTRKIENMNTKNISQYVPGQMSHFGQILTGEQPVSERAVLYRLNRILNDNCEVIKKCRENSRLYVALGDYYVIDSETKKVMYTHLDLDEFARFNFVLKDCEVLAE